MTLVIAAEGQNYVILGADSRATIRDAAGMSVAINVAVKLMPLSKHVGILVFGAGETATYLALKFKRKMNANLDGVSNVEEKFAEFCRQEFKKNEVPLASLHNFGFIIAGLDRKGSKFVLPHCYKLLSNCYFMDGSSKPYAIDGRPFIAYYLFERGYGKVKDWSGLCSLVAQAIYDTRAVDGTVGGRIRLAVIDSNGYRELPAPAIRDLVQKWGDDIESEAP